jgi:hypothetical protein
VVSFHDEISREWARKVAPQSRDASTLPDFSRDWCYGIATFVSIDLTVISIIGVCSCLRVHTLPILLVLLQQS